MSLPPSIRVNVRAPFPSRVLGSAFIQVVKALGIWTISPNFRLLNPIAAVSATQILAVQDQITGAFGYVNVLQLLSANSIYRPITAPGSVTVLPTDVTLLFKKTSSGTSSIQLPNSATRNGAPVRAKDETYDSNTNNITFVPAVGELIDGFSGAAAAANGAAVLAIDGGMKTLWPLVSGGWYVE